MKLARAAGTRYALTCRHGYGFDQAGSSVSVVDSAHPLRVMSFELVALGSKGNGGNGNLQMTKPGLSRVRWTTESAIACRISDDTGRATSVPPNGTRIIQTDETLAMQINCVSRGAEAQSLAQAEGLGKALFFDDFEG